MAHFFAQGTPVPKGSLRHVGNGRLVEQTKAKPWMAVIRQAALSTNERFEVPVQVNATFYFPRPKAAKNRIYPHMRSAGDLDKLCRALLDALQDSKADLGILSDDSLVVSLSAQKVYADSHEPGVEVLVRELI